MINVDLTAENSVDIGSTYKVIFQLCNAPDLTTYTGVSQIRSSVTSEAVILTPNINILTKDRFEFIIPFGLFTSDVVAGNYVYDVLFTKSDDRFYACGGKISLVQRVTKVS